MSRLFKDLRSLLALLYIVVGTIFGGSVVEAQTKIQSTVSQKTSVSKRSESTSRNNLYIEALGRGGIYSLGYEYHASRRAGIGLGYSFQSMQLNPTSAEGKIQLHTFPVYSTLYFPFGSHRPFISAGATGLWVKTTAQFKFSDLLQQFSVTTQKNTEEADTYVAQIEAPDLENKVELFLAIPNLTAGYEYRMNSGSFSRAQLITFIADKPIIWLGLSFGVGF